jgi:hypothetical protein
MRVDDIVAEIREFLTANADPAVVAKYQGYFKEGYDAGHEERQPGRAARVGHREPERGEDAATHDATDPDGKGAENADVAPVGGRMVRGGLQRLLLVVGEFTAKEVDRGLRHRSQTS